MTRIALDRLELEQKLELSLTRAAPSLIKQMLTDRDTPAAESGRKLAMHLLAKHIAAELQVSKHEVTRPAVGEEQEAILQRLREAQERREA